MHLLKHLIFFAPFLTFYYYAFNVQTFCYAFAPSLPLPAPASPAPSCSLAAQRTQPNVPSFLLSPFPFPLPVIHAASCAVCSFRLGAFTHTPCPHVTCLAFPAPAPCTLCQPVAVALQQLRRIAASGFVATKAFVANNFTSLPSSLCLLLSCN